MDYGLVDGIEDLYSFIQKRYGDNVKIEHIENKQIFAEQRGQEEPSKQRITLYEVLEQGRHSCHFSNGVNNKGRWASLIFVY